MKRRGFFARVAGAVAGLFGAASFVGSSSAATGTVGKLPKHTPHFVHVSLSIPTAEHCWVALDSHDESHVEAMLIGIEAGALQQQLAHNPERFSIHALERCVEPFKMMCEHYGRKPESIRLLDSDGRWEMVVPPPAYHRDSAEGYYDGFAQLMRAA